MEALEHFGDAHPLIANAILIYLVLNFLPANVAFSRGHRSVAADPFRRD